MLRLTRWTLLGLGLFHLPAVVAGAGGDLIWNFVDLESPGVCSKVSTDRGTAFTQYWSEGTELVRGFDVATGALRWQATGGPGEVASDLTAGDGMVLSTTYSPALAGTSVGTVFTRARDAATGDLLWSQSLGPGHFRYESTAIAFDSKVTAVVGGRRTAGDPGNVFDFFVATYDTTTGAPRWTDVFDVSRSWDRAEAVAVGGGVVAVGGRITRESIDLFHVRVYSALSGTLLWHNSVGGREASALVIRGGRIYVTGLAGFSLADGSHVRAYELRTGALLWQRHVPDAWMQSIAILGKKLVVGGRREDRKSEVRAYRRDTGRSLWRSRRTRSVVRDLAVGTNRVYAAGDVFNGFTFIQALKGGSAKRLWSRGFGASKGRPENCSLALENGYLVVASSLGAGGGQIVSAYVP
ncbi:MAG: PQQ-like beta-propeller repeat protein [Acidobacteriota bacterium]|nr:PQQ-like beta-propeller repeat protein [Acidobacteriota bacterium]